jgi:hypothetical protein
VTTRFWAERPGSAPTPEIAERAEIALHAKKSMWLRKRWRKWPDTPLAEVVAAKLRRPDPDAVQDGGSVRRT